MLLLQRSNVQNIAICVQQVWVVCLSFAIKMYSCFFRQNHQLQSMRQSLYNERKKFDLLDFVVSLCLFICMHMHLRINLYNFSSSKLPRCSSIYMFTHCLSVCNQTVLIITLLGPGSTSSCTDKVNCAQYGTSFCSDPSYTAFTQENCPKHCNMC